MFIVLAQPVRIAVDMVEAKDITLDINWDHFEILLRRLLTQRFLTFRCVPCVNIKDSDDVLSVNEGPQLPCR